jgi:hypothetical protein
VQRLTTSCASSCHGCWERTCSRVFAMLGLGIFVQMRRRAMRRPTDLAASGQSGCGSFTLDKSSRRKRRSTRCRTSLGRSLAGPLWGVLYCCAFGLALSPRPPRSGPRDFADIDRGRVSGRTAALRAKLLAEFKTYVEENTESNIEVLSRSDVPSLACCLEAYGKHLFVERRLLRDFAETVNAVQQTYHWTRGSLSAAWRVLRTWEDLEPTEVHQPMPESVLQAMVCTALCWEWPRVAMLLLIGFYSLLRPIELYSLRPQDLILPAIHGMMKAIFVRIGDPKTKRRGARRQHAKIDKEYAVEFLTRWLPKFPSSEKIWDFSPATFRKRFMALRAALGTGLNRMLPSSLRPGGATALFHVVGENVAIVAWRGRWQSLLMLERYVQELHAALIEYQMPPETKTRVQGLADECQAVLQD